MWIKYLKNVYAVLTTSVLLSMGILSGCSDDPAEFLEFSNDNFLLEAAGDTVMVDVVAGSEWYAESTAAWCSVEKGTGTHDGKLIISVSPSDDIYERGAAVKVVCGANVMRLAVRQRAAYWEVADAKKALNFDRIVSYDTLKVRTNLNWKVEMPDSINWISLVGDTVGNGDVNLIFKTTDNSQNKERSISFRVYYGIHSLKLTATQEGGVRADGHIKQHYGTMDPSKAFNLVFLSDGFVESDLVTETGAFEKAVEEACSALWGVEPYTTYKEYFNVYSIACLSQESGVSTDAGLKQTAFQSLWKGEVDGQPRLEFSAFDKAKGYVENIMGMNKDILNNQTVIVVLVNEDIYAGQTYFMNDSYLALSVVPLHRGTELPGGFTNIFLHEVGGHAIGKLADEWGDPANVLANRNEFLTHRNNLYYYNLGFPNTKALMNYPAYVWDFGSETKYSGIMGCFDGGAGYVSGTAARTFVVHSEQKSCMINHQPYFSVGCRWAIVQWLLIRLNVYVFDQAGWTECYNYFIANDKFEVPADPVVGNLPHLPLPVFME